MPFHTESDFIAPVISALQSYGGSATFAQIRDFIERMNPQFLNEDDWQTLPSEKFPRWHQVVRNLKSNKVLRNKGLVVEIDKGFALTPKGWR